MHKSDLEKVIFTYTNHSVYAEFFSVIYVKLWKDVLLIERLGEFTHRVRMSWSAVGERELDLCVV